MVAGTTTRIGPICAMQSTKTMAARSAGVRDPGEEQPGPREHRLRHRGDDDPQGHGPDRLGREDPGVLSPVPREAAEEAKDAARHGFARGVEDARHDHHEEELDDGGAHPSRLRRDPARHLLGVGLEPRDHRLRVPREGLPLADQPRAHDGHPLEPGGRRGEALGGEGVQGLPDSLGIARRLPRRRARSASRSARSSRRSSPRPPARGAPRGAPGGRSGWARWR